MMWFVQGIKLNVQYIGQLTPEIIFRQEKSGSSTWQRRYSDGNRLTVDRYYCAKYFDLVSAWILRINNASGIINWVISGEICRSMSVDLLTKANSWRHWVLDNNLCSRPLDFHPGGGYSQKIE